MRRVMVLMLIIGLVIGCGKREEKQSFQGVTQSRNYIEEGMKFLAQKDVPRAIRSFDLAIKNDPRNPDNYMVLGEVYLRLKNYSRAIDTFAAALQIDPMNGEAYYLMASSKLLRGEDKDKEEAIEALKKSAAIFSQEKNEEKLKRSLLMLRSIVENIKQEQT